MMNSKTLLVTLGAFVLLSPAAAPAAEPTPGHWSYSGDTGPARWGDLEADYATCKTGKAQSPINIETGTAEKPASLPAIKPQYKLSAGELVNNGHTIQINLADAGSAALSDGDYKLIQFHFHAPSEEEIDGKSYPLVAHLVHKDGTGRLAVIAVLFKEGKPNPALAQLFANLPRQEGKQPLGANFDASALLPSSLSYYAFAGSLTTPPCSEGVAWHVLKQPVEASAAQIAAFRAIFPENARPVQPLNARKVLEAN